ncbi:MAG: GNAT family N-acetyltransferase [Ignavibacteriales bacterium]|nr:GNAT family N-acetyltransferase [Ignavibacteriales bacterium]
MVIPATVNTNEGRCILPKYRRIRPKVQFCRDLNFGFGIAGKGGIADFKYDDTIHRKENYGCHTSIGHCGKLAGAHQVESARGPKPICGIELVFHCRSPVWVGGVSGRWDFHPFGAHVNDTPVGFVMYCFNFNHPRFQAFIMRLMVDERFQGKGYGRAIMQQVLDVFRENEQVKNVGISYEPHNESARKLYASLGFVEPGEMLEDETLAVLSLR